MLPVSLFMGRVDSLDSSPRLMFDRGVMASQGFTEPHSSLSQARQNAKGLLARGLVWDREVSGRPLSQSVQMPFRLFDVIYRDNL